MKNISIKAILAVVVITFIFSAVYYAALSGPYFELRGVSPTDPAAAMGPWDFVILIGRHLTTALVVAYLVAKLNITRVSSAIGLGVLLFVGFTLVLLVGSVSSDKVPVALAAIHGGDWLFKLVIMTTLLTVWRPNKKVSKKA